MAHLIIISLQCEQVNKDQWNGLPKVQI